MTKPSDKAFDARRAAHNLCWSAGVCTASVRDPDAHHGTMCHAVREDLEAAYSAGRAEVDRKAKAFDEICEARERWGAMFVKDGRFIVETVEAIQRYERASASPVPVEGKRAPPGTVELRPGVYAMPDVKSAFVDIGRSSPSETPEGETCGEAAGYLSSVRNMTGICTLPRGHAPTMYCKGSSPSETPDPTSKGTP